MERLTVEYCGEYVPRELCSIDREGGADDCDLCCEYCKATEEGNEDCRECAISRCFNKLGEYENLEGLGKLLKLPVPVGSLVYEPYQFLGEGAWEIDVHTIRLEDLDKIGKSVFLTREEAEVVLKESKQIVGQGKMENDLISRNIVFDYLKEQQANVIIEKNKKGFVPVQVCEGMMLAIEAFMNFVVQAPAAYNTDKERCEKPEVEN